MVTIKDTAGFMPTHFHSNPLWYPRTDHVSDRCSPKVMRYLSRQSGKPTGFVPCSCSNCEWVCLRCEIRAERFDLVAVEKSDSSHAALPIAFFYNVLSDLPINVTSSRTNELKRRSHNPARKTVLTNFSRVIFIGQ